MADITELVGYTGYVGREDIQFGKGTETFSVTTSTGGTVSLTKIPSPDANTYSILKGVYYPKLGVTDHAATGQTGSLAAVLVDVGVAETDIELPSGDLPVATTLTVPTTCRLRMQRGAIFSGAGTIIFSGVKSIDAGMYQIFNGPTVTFQSGQRIHSSWFANLSAAITAMSGVSGEIVVDPGSHTVAVDFTGSNYSGVKLIITSGADVAFSGVRTTDMKVRVKDGGTISPASGGSITLNNGVDAGLYKIFDGEGTVYLDRLSVCYPEWFGAVADGTDSTVEMQAAIDTQTTVQLSKGTYKWTDTIYPYPSLTIQGLGQQTEIIVAHTGDAVVIDAAERSISATSGKDQAGKFISMTFIKDDTLVPTTVIKNSVPNYQLVDLRFFRTKATDAIISNEAAYALTIERCSFNVVVCHYAIALRQTPTETQYSYNIRITSCDITNVSYASGDSVGVYQQGGQAQISDSVIEACDVAILSGDGVAFNPQLLLTNVYMEANIESYITTTTGDDYAPNITMKHCYLNGGSHGASTADFVLGRGAFLIIDACRFAGGVLPANTTATATATIELRNSRNIGLESLNNIDGLKVYTNIPYSKTYTYDDSVLPVPGVSLRTRGLQYGTYIAIVMFSRRTVADDAHGWALYGIQNVNAARGYRTVLIDSDTVGGVSAQPTFSINAGDATDYNLYFKIASGYGQVTVLLPNLG